MHCCNLFLSSRSLHLKVRQLKTMKPLIAWLILGWVSLMALLAGDDHRQVMKIDREVKIIPARTAKLFLVHQKQWRSASQPVQV